MCEQIKKNIYKWKDIPIIIGQKIFVLQGFLYVQISIMCFP